MTDGKAWEILQYTFLTALANDGLVDAEELEWMKSLALADGKVDETERAVLSTIFGRLSPDLVDPDVLVEIERFKAAYDIA